MNFASDNNSGVCPAVLDALVAEAGEFGAAYGADRRSGDLVARLCELFETDIRLYCVPTGTAANSLALAAVNPSWGAVLCSDRGHIVADECAAPTVIGAGLTLLPQPSDHGKLSAYAIERFLAERHDTGVHSIAVTSVSVAQVTEMGTRYSPAELSELCEIAHSRDMAVHLDGARFANAVAASGCSPADLSWRSGVDIMSLGATKGGALGAEAVIVFDTDRVRDDIGRLRKRTGHLLSKLRFTAAQFVGWLDGDMWLELATHANAMAARLADGLQANHARLSHRVDANMVFAWLDQSTIAALTDAGATFYKESPIADQQGRIEVRLVTSWSTTTEDVDRFVAVVSHSQPKAQA
ncbi:MAG: threonine aldolase family protein [Microthrixaceae bacterium]